MSQAPWTERANVWREEALRLAAANGHEMAMGDSVVDLGSYHDDAGRLIEEDEVMWYCLYCEAGLAVYARHVFDPLSQRSVAAGGIDGYVDGTHTSDALAEECPARGRLRRWCEGRVP